MDSVMQEKILAARAGDEAALAAIIAGQMTTIRAYAAKAACPALEFDDAVQEGIIGLFSAVNGFRENEAASFSTYASVCIQNAITSAVRRAVRKKHAPLNESIPLTEQHTAPGPEYEAEAGETYTRLMQDIDTRLSSFERSVLDLYLQQNSYTQIAKSLATTEKSVDNAIQRIRAKLK